jgi:purine-binding chemotaxis protein CheW
MNAASPVAAVESQRGLYLSFSLAGDEYAVDILRVREIRGVGPITPIPNAPPFVRGVMNLRGSVVPVVDTRAAIGLTPAEYNKFTVIIVLLVRERTMGFVVDAVSDVLALDESSIERSVDLGQRVRDSFVEGIGRVQDRFVVLLDIDRIAAMDLPEGAAG